MNSFEWWWIGKKIKLGNVNWYGEIYVIVKCYRDGNQTLQGCLIFLTFISILLSGDSNYSSLWTHTSGTISEKKPYFEKSCYRNLSFDLWSNWL